jgi:aryl-alcohol dehydrogenase-like predicted oxidoreductase
VSDVAMQGLLSGKYTSPTQLEPGRLRTRIFRPDRAPQSRHGTPGVEEEVFGENGLLKRLQQHSDDAGCSLVDCSVAWLLSRTQTLCVLVGASSPEQSKRNATVAPVGPAVLQHCTEESEQLKALLYARGNIVDQYAAATRIHGNEVSAGPRL